jgi:hypothetical protein
MRLSYAPIKSVIANDEPPVGEWQSWLGTLGTCLRGEWRRQSIGAEGRCAIQGAMMSVSFDWADYPSGTIDLPVQVENGVLQMVAENGTFIAASLVSGKTITVTASTHSGRTLATGVLIVKEAT